MFMLSDWKGWDRIPETWCCHKRNSQEPRLCPGAEGCDTGPEVCQSQNKMPVIKLVATHIHMVKERRVGNITPETVMFFVLFFPPKWWILPIQETLHLLYGDSYLFSQPPASSFHLVMTLFFSFSSFFCPPCSVIPGSGFYPFKPWHIITDE